MSREDSHPLLSPTLDGVYCELDPEVGSIGIGDWNLQNGFSAAVELAQECFAVEQPRVRKFFALGAMW